MLLFPCEEAKKQSEASNTTGVEYLDIRIMECRNRVITAGEVYLIAISKGATQVKFDLISTRYNILVGNIELAPGHAGSATIWPRNGPRIRALRIRTTTLASSSLSPCPYSFYVGIFWMPSPVFGYITYF